MKPTNQTPAERPPSRDDLHTRFERIEDASDQQLAALHRLDVESKTTACGVVRNGQLAALEGRFVTGTDDPIKGAIAFLEKHATALGFDIRDEMFAEPQLADCEEEVVHNVRTVFFEHQLHGVPTYRAGIAVGVDLGGAIRFVRALVPPPMDIPRPLDAAGAREVVAAALGEGELPEPTFALFDPALVLGETGRPVGVWVFDFPEGTPRHVLVQDGQDKVFRIILNPGCPVGALPTYHMNQATGSPDMVLFPGAGILLPEVSTRNAATVARAMFERFPKLFGTGDPTSQLALGEVLTGPDPQIPTTTVVFHQRWGALPVFGCQLRVHLSKALAVRSITGHFLRDPNVSTTPTVTEAAARMTASMTMRFDTPDGPDRTYYPQPPHPPVRTGPSRRTATAREASSPEGTYPGYEGDRYAPNGGSDARPAHPPVSTLERPQRPGEGTRQPSEQGARADAFRLAAEFHRALKDDPDRAATMGVGGAEDHGLVILPTMLTRSGLGQNHLAWWFRFQDADRFVSATTGALVLELPRILSAERVFDGQNTADPTVEGNPQFIDGSPQVPTATLDPDAQVAALAVSQVATFWQIFRRDSWDGVGGDMDAYVDVLFGTKENPAGNATWDGSRTLFSPQFAVPDVVGHEFTHALVAATANFVPVDEPYAANEHYADLFGSLMFPDIPPTQWLLGENIPSRPNGIRDMRNPNVARYQDYLIAKNADPHENAGILNRAAVLMSDGDPPARATGIGRSRLARLAWETLVFRLYPWASFVDIMHVTWALARELADAGALGAAGVPESGIPAGQVPPAFDGAATDTVAWAFQQVGLLLDVQAGWHDVTVNTPFDIQPGVSGFVAVETLYPTPPTPLLADGRTLTDIEVRFTRHNVFTPNGSLRVSTGGTFNAPDGSYSAMITSPTSIDPTNLQTVVRITSPTATDVYVNGVPDIADPPDPPPSQPAQPPITTLDSPLISHSIDVVPFGWDYDDVLYQGGELPVGCFVADVELRVMGIANISDVHGDFTYLIESTTAVGVNVGEPHKGAHIVSRTLGGRSVKVHVHAWHHPYVGVHYVVRYYVAGNGSSLPPFN